MEVLYVACRKNWKDEQKEAVEKVNKKTFSILYMSPVEIMNWNYVLKSDA